MKFLCLDFEGVLIPEIWQYVAKETNSEELMLTTQDLKNYDELMALRMKVVNEKNIKLSDIQEIVRSMNPFEGAKDFLEWAKQNFQVSIISDTFYELAWPLVEKLNYPTIICHHLEIKNDRIIDYSLRHNKQKVIEALLSLNFGVLAAGDSYNDIDMLQTADTGIFFQAPDHIKEEFPDLLIADNHEELKAHLLEYI
ncbi:MAG: bifunctional phosphoserine phosphatase/homoserine phosphotransferase ThrH [Pseudomonadota bacterium]|nr:bifunctional phosphoserine phosphatase/homoserine phosphotransferase ThrH [Pseudomonadota bacterium]